ncbi:MAG: methionyl-tRNA formyltransferase [Alphaproteobacteria bacterium]|nr:methionyl-tRNA formyltransferase [Alphaproteobacteria bacterium]
MTSLRLAFMGTPDFAVPTLEALLAHGHDIAAVYTQPPRPSGRGHKLQPSPVQRAATKHGLTVHAPATLRNEQEQEAFRALGLDAAIVVAYGLILPRAILDAPAFGCFNLHGSLLPRWRGAAPMQRAIMAGDTKTGAMVMRMEEGLDTGPVLATWRTPLTDEMTAGDLHDLLSVEGAKLMAETVDRLARGAVTEEPQLDGVTYAKKITVEEARIDWTRPAHDVLRHIHGLNPAPGAWTMAGDTRLKLLRVRESKARGQPGEIVGALTVACGTGSIDVVELQRAGREVQTADAFLRGFDLPKGARLV